MTKEHTGENPIGPVIMRPTLSVDWELYAQYLEASGWSEAKQREFIETVWSIVISFVDLGFNILPAQQALEGSCAQHIELTKFITAETLPVVSLSDTSNAQFKATDSAKPTPLQERNAK